MRLLFWSNGGSSGAGGKTIPMGIYFYCNLSSQVYHTSEKSQAITCKVKEMSVNNGHFLKICHRNIKLSDL